MKKENIRKIILEEFLKKVDKEREQIDEGFFIPAVIGLAGGEALIRGLNTFGDSPRSEKVRQALSSNPKNNFFGLYGKVIEKIEGPLIISDSEANKLAKRLADATIDYNEEITAVGQAIADAMGNLGTDEDEIEKVIKAAQTKVNLSKVGLAFGKKYGENFADVFKDELSPEDQNLFVVDPIMKLPFITILDGDEVVELSEKEFMEEIELAKEDEATDPANRPDLGIDLTAPFIAKIIQVMNAYNDVFKMKGYTPCSGGKWTSSVQKCWEIFFPHAIANCDAWGTEYDMGDFPNGSNTKWPEISALMSSDFPRYTNNPKGCLAFCLDAYYCDIRFGTNPAGAMFGDGGVGDNGGGAKDGDGDDLKDKPPAAAIPGGPIATYAGIEIVLGKTGAGFKDAGFTLPGGSDPDYVIKRNLMLMQSNRSQTVGFPGNTVNLDLVVNKKGDKVIDIKRLKFDGSMRGFKPKRSNIKSDLLSFARDLEFPREGDYAEGSDSFDVGKRADKVIKVGIIIPAGRY